jgi:biotin-(acetyl-CoA carboxylase) ligase
VERIHNHLIIGIGINTNNSLAGYDGLIKSISLVDCFGFKISHKALLNNFLVHFAQAFLLYERHGIEYFTNYINANLLWLGKRIAFKTGQDIIRGLCLGISDDGALLIRIDSGETVSSYSGSIISGTD